MTVSMKDVALAAGVDKSTVSRVLSGKGDQWRVCPATQNRIREVAHQLGYAPSSLIHFRPPARELLKENVVGLTGEMTAAAQTPKPEIPAIEPVPSAEAVPEPAPVAVSLPNVTVVETPIEAEPVAAPSVETPPVVTPEPELSHCRMRR